MSKNKCVTCNKIDPDSDDFGLMLNCAVRYALGRETYMPTAVMQFVRPYIKFLTERTLVVMIRDIEEYGGYSHNEDERKKAYGMECDYRDWMRFLEELKIEQSNRSDSDK